MGAPDGQTVIIGGGSFAGRWATVTAMYPFVRITVDGEGVRVDIRPRLLKRLLSPLLAERGSPVVPVWAASWDELAPVIVGPLSAVLLGSERECRVIVVRRRRLEPLLDAARARAVTLIRRPTTLGWYLPAGWSTRRER